MIDMPEINAVPVHEFESKPDCPKCPSDEENLNFVFCSGGVDASTCKGLPKDYEHLHVHCNECGYDFIMDTRDAEERKKAREEAAAAEKEVETTTTEVAFSEGE